MPTITVPDDVYERLAVRAAAAGTTVEAIALPILVRVAEEEPPLSPSELPFIDWKKNMAALDAVIHTIMDGRLPPDFVLDDSRESIYEGCGE